MLENYIKTKTKTNLILKQIKKSEKMSQNTDSGTGSQLSKYNSTCWRWKIITSQLLMLLIR